MSRVIMIISALVICIITACHGPLIITDNATYKARAGKNARELVGDRGNY